MSGIVRVGRAALAALVVVPRLYLGLAGKPVYFNDSASYLAAMRSLLSTGVVEDFGYRTPGYPVFLALCSAFGEAEQVAVLVQQLLGIAIGAFVFDMGRRVWRTPLAGWAALALYAIDLRFVIAGQAILTELLQTFVVVASTWAFVVWCEGGSRAAVAAMTVLLGIAPLVRPVAQLFAPVAAVFVAMALLRRGATGWRAFVPALLVVAVAALPPAGWIVRNGLRYGSWKLTPMHYPHLLERVIHLVDLQSGGDEENRRLLASVVERERSRLGSGLRLFLRLREKGLDVAQADAVCGRFVFETVRNRTGTYFAELPWLLFANLRLASGHPDIRARWAEGELVLQGWPTWGPAVFEGASSVVPWLERSIEKIRSVPVSTTLVKVLTHTWLALALLALAAAGLVRAARDGEVGDPRILLIAATIAYYCVLPTLTVPSSDRFRLPVEPLLIVLAAGAISPRDGRSQDSSTH